VYGETRSGAIQGTGAKSLARQPGATFCSETAVKRQGMKSTPKTHPRPLGSAWWVTFPCVLAAVCVSTGRAVGPAVAPNQQREAVRIARIEDDLRVIDGRGEDTAQRHSIAERMKALGVPGLSVTVFDGGTIIWSRGYGVRDRVAGDPVNEQTSFQAASISKPVTSAALFRMIEEGRLALDDDVNLRLRSWKVPDSEFTRTEKVTPRRIVSHMAGLTVHGFGGYATNAPLPTVPQILDGLPPANSPPVRVTASPGVRESYSGGGFTVLQLLMQDVAGRPFKDLLDDLLLRPLKMTRSTFAQPLPPQLAEAAATGYQADGRPIAGRFHVYPELAAAGLWTTPSDLARFMLAIGRSYRGEAGGLLRRDTATLMLTKIPNAGGLGFGLSGEGRARRYRHNGGNAGFTCYAVAFTDTGRGVVLMTNSDGGDGLMREFARAIAREYGWPYMWVRE
jgi:CubicO group peptidase (beta-lactamase class C family)